MNQPALSPLATNAPAAIDSSARLAPFRALSSVTAKGLCSVTAKRQKNQRETVTEHGPDLAVFVNDDELSSLIRADRVAVHQHGSKRNYADYTGRYWLLRLKGKRTEARPVLASGRPEKLKDHLAKLGVDLCLDHRSLNCPKCHL